MTYQTETTPQSTRSVALRYLLALGVLIFLVTAFALAIRPAVQAASDAGPDLTAEITINPPVPNPGEPAQISVVVRNRGNVASSGTFTVSLYINPADRPPGSGTPLSYFWGYGISIPANSATAPLHRPHTFTVDDIGCNNVIYVWVDREGRINDTDRSNNLVALQVCVGVQCVVDDYEGVDGDDDSGKAGWITADSTQERSFCRDTNSGLTPAGDNDWVKFTAFAGLTYTLSTGNIGQHADPRITLLSGGLTQALDGPASQVSFFPPASGVFYAHVRNSDAKDGTGPLTRYDLTLSAVPAVTDSFEPDDTCAQAREILTDGTPQTRLFQAPGDTDWVKFTLQAGESFSMIADQTAQGVNPTITLFNSCQQSRSTENVAEGVRQVQGRSTAEQIYYARITNQNPNRFGADASYRLSVLASTCVPDGFEEDDTFNQAKALAVGETQTNRNFCPAGDQDWVKFNLQAGQIYVIKTSNLGFASDTVLELHDDKGNKIAINDDYDYVKASRIIFEPSTSGTYYAMVRHHDPRAAGANTNYDLTLETGFCVPDAADADGGDNGPGDARTVPTNGTAVERNFCANPLSRSLGDQDWMRFSAVAGGTYRIFTEELGPNADTVLRVYDRDGATLLKENDDKGSGLSAELVFTPAVSGDHFVQVTQFNASVVGRETEYRLRIEENLPPPPTPTPSPTPSPTPAPTPTPAVDPSTVQTLILVNQARMTALHGSGPATTVLNKLFELADHPKVNGAVVQVESNPAVAAAYTDWISALNNPAATAEEKNNRANIVSETIRNMIFSFSATAPDLAYIVVVGDDRVIPFHRIREANLAKREEEYAQQLAGGSTIAAALAENMILTDDYYAALEPGQWQGNEFYVPHYAIGRLIQTPAEITGIIDIFLQNQVINGESGKALVTGYDFVQDSATLIRNLMLNDGIPSVSSTDFINNLWSGNQLRPLMLTSPTVGSRFDIVSINGHATHLAIGVPDTNNTTNNDIRANEIVAATNSFARSLVYNVGCHGGLNDSDALDLAQAFVQRGAVYVGNTGFGWGGGGIVYSEALMRNFTRELLTEKKAVIGPSLTAAKQSYVSRARAFGGYDAKILMQTTLYGLPMFEITSGGTLSGDDPFPSVEDSFSPPGSFGTEINRGSFGYGLPGSFGAFGSDQTNPEYKLDLDGNVVFEAGAPIQPSYYRDLSAPNAGSLRGVLFLGGVYAETVAEAPIALAYNEYVTDTTPPEFDASGWYPPVPFAVQSSAFTPGVRDTVVLALGQYDSETGAQRVFDQMSFDTYYSSSPDRSLADIQHVDAVLDTQTGQGIFKVEATDDSSISRVVIAYTLGTGAWSSQDLVYDTVTAKWTGTITATANTRYFVQVVDGAGNIAIDDNKGRYHPLLPPLPLAEGRSLEQRIYLPIMMRGG
jgi:hypothetical protein